MSDCRSNNRDVDPQPKRHVCPKNGKQYHEVSFSTVLHHVKEPWKHVPKEQTYYYCFDPDCDVVYFGIDNSTILKNQLRTKVGVKESGEDGLICYCFDISKAQAQTSEQAKVFVIEQTRSSACSCSTHNPSGRCCLKDFPKD